MIDKYAVERQRDEDWERAQIKQVGTLKFLVFYILIGICGAAGLIFGIVTLFTDHRFWGHSLAELILGGCMLLLAPIGFLGDTAGFRGKLYD